MRWSSFTQYFRRPFQAFREECDAFMVLALIILLLIFANLCGLFDILIFESSFASDFSWPPHVFDYSSYQSYQKASDSRRIDYMEFSASLTSSLEEWKLNAAFWRLEGSQSEEGPVFAPGMMGMISQLPPVRSHIKYLKAITEPTTDLPAPFVCTQPEARQQLTLLILVKSALSHFAQREAIRKTWAAGVRHKQGSQYEVLFVLGLAGGSGVSGQGEFSYNYQDQVLEEQWKHGDIIQCKFIDSYFNNTSKFIAGLHYVTDSCPLLDPRHGFLYFSDDDMFVHVPHLLALVEEIRLQREKPGVISTDVYLGMRFPGSKPKRWRFSKWYVSTSEYPFSWYPPYITAAAVLLARDTADKLYYASHFVPLFRFDDIYLGILAHILGIESQHRGEPYFYFDYMPLDDESRSIYRDSVVAVHGYSDPKLLMDTYEKLRKN